MAYSYRTRLERNSVRFNSVNIESVDINKTDGSVMPCVKVSPILRRPDTHTEAPLEVSFDRQWFAIDTLELEVNGAVVYPEAGDLITRPSGDVFEVIPEHRDSPAWEYVTANRDRIIVHTQIYG